MGSEMCIRDSYVAEVNVFKDASQLPIKPFSTPVIYAFNPWGPKAQPGKAETDDAEWYRFCIAQLA